MTTGLKGFASCRPKGGSLIPHRGHLDRSLTSQASCSVDNNRNDVEQGTGRTGGRARYQADDRATTTCPNTAKQHLSTERIHSPVATIIHALFHDDHAHTQNLHPSTLQIRERRPTTLRGADQRTNLVVCAFRAERCEQPRRPHPRRDLSQVQQDLSLVFQLRQRTVLRAAR